MDIEVRVAKLEDFRKVHELTQAAYAEYSKEPGASTALKETVLNLYTQFYETNFFLLAESKGKPVGSVRFRKEGDAIYFHRLAVSPKHRRRGIATRLIEVVEIYARQEKSERLTCSVRLEKADNIALYTKLGFQLLGERSVCRDGTEVPTGDFEKRLV